ncbi:MAG: transcription antitermination factor NusB [Acidobacteriota bacterium]
MSRRRGRELAMQMLFQEEMGGGSPAEVEELFWRCHRASQEVRQFATLLYRTANAEKASIDERLSRFARNWRLERLNPVDRNILRTAVAEFLAGVSPRAVIVDEAVEIARAYGSDERSAEFVNGVLDAVLAELEAK